MLAWLQRLLGGPKRPKAAAPHSRHSHHSRHSQGGESSQGPLSESAPPSEADDGATQLMSPRAMVNALVNEIMTGAGVPSDQRSTRLYSLSATVQEAQLDGEQFILLVKFKVDRSELWPYLPALGSFIGKQIKARLGIRVEQVFWSLTRGVPASQKIPAAWVEAMGPDFKR